MQDIDGVIARRLRDIPAPAVCDLVDAARLLRRYNGFPGCQELRSHLSAALARWGLTPSQLDQRCLEIWQQGYHPQPGDSTVAVGSGFDSASE